MCGACGGLQNSDHPDDTKKENMSFLQDYAPLPSSLTYWWMDWLFTLGYRKPIEPSDLGSIPDKHTADAIHAIFKKNYLKEKVKSVAHNASFRLLALILASILALIMPVQEIKCMYSTPCFVCAFHFTFNHYHSHQACQRARQSLTHFCVSKMAPRVQLM